MSGGVDNYQLEGEFEATVVHYLVESKGFAFHFLPYLKTPDKAHDHLFASPYASLVVGLINAFFKKHGRPPGGSAAVSSMVVNLYNKGKITRGEKEATLEYLADSPLYLTSDEDDAFTLFAEHIREWKQYLATRAAIGLQMERKDISEVATMILEANAVTIRKETTATVARADDFSTWSTLIKASGNRERLPTYIDILDTFLDGGLARRALGLFFGGTGCHRAGTEILMASGRTKLVEDIAVGDVVAGPSGPRTVLKLHRGVSQMVEIQPTKGEPWVVNMDHVLTLVNTKDRGVGALRDVTVREWLTWNAKQKHLHKLIRVGVDAFDGGARPLADSDLTPYMMGVILGDGGWTSGSLVVHKPDPEIMHACELECARFGQSMVTFGSGTPRAYRLNRGAAPTNGIRDALTRYKLWGVASERRFIPAVYRLATREQRLQLLAGLLDTDGHMTRGGYDFISKSKRLADGLAFVARSVGLAAYVKPSEKYCQTGGGGTYYRVSVTGDCTIIPCRVPRKKATARKMNKDVRRSGFSVAVLPGEESYYGFELDGDGRYLLGDFTVTHNSGKSMTLSEIAAASLVAGEDTAYISLEVDTPEIASRVFAPIAGLPISLLVKNPDGAEPYMMKTFERAGVKPGRLVLEEFPAGITVAECLLELDKRFEQYGFRPNVLVIDYLDRFGGGSTRVANSYEAGRDITEMLKNYAKKHNAWCWSAVQAKRFLNRAAAAEADENSGADSQHKARIADVIVNILVNKDGPQGDEIAMRISKHRGGKGGQKSEWIPADYSYGIVFPSRMFRPVPVHVLSTDPNYSDLIADLVKAPPPAPGRVLKRKNKAASDVE